MVLLSVTFIYLCHMKGNVMTFKASPDFREHLEKQAVKKKLKTGTFIKAILKKHTGFKEKELV